MVNQKLSSPERNGSQEDLPTPEVTSSREDIQTWQRQLVQGALRVSVIVGFLAAAAGSYYEYIRQTTLWTIPIYWTAYAFVVLITFWRRVPYIVQAGTLIAAFYGLAILDFVTDGRGGSGRLFFLMFLFAAGLFLGRRESIFAIALTFLTLVGLAWAFTTGRIAVAADVSSTDLAGWVSNIVILLLVGAFVLASNNYLIPRLMAALAKSRQLAGEIEKERGRLAEQVLERTKALERHNAQLEAATQVTHHAASALDMDELVLQVATSIGNQFGFYHTGIFILDATGEWAELKAASGIKAEQILASEHRLHVGGVGSASSVTSQGEPRIVSDAMTEAMFFRSPDLPDTRSEITLPLRARNRTVGLLNLHSTQPQAFSREDVAVLQTLADHVAMAIGNAYLFQQVQQSLAAERRTAAQLAQQAWQGLLRAQRELGVVRNKDGLTALSPAVDAQRPEMEIARQTGKATLDASSRRSLAVPVKVRDRVIGVIDARKPEGAWTQEEIALVETLTDQLGVALDSARLYQDTQRRAARERLIGEVAAHMRERLDVDGVLKAAAQEIGEKLGLHDIAIQLEMQGDKAS
jgi:GAF domain-containing protein